ncbi:envelope stress response protein PspG [Vibrio viridaestus]|uniref:Envelope stress response protein PspG n=1 Tax=Vibrio viridaestus TaxID=2487322 RepID=A0A3N9TAJ8_9VIBR|nr:envelope stress response protein PspG [Vibrio viridaestus]RQW61059.1 envelope stress response protein PspG [Vibrio viridaestus]
MFELLIFLIFVSSLFVIGITAFGMVAAFIITTVVMVLLGTLSLVIKLVPWLVVIAIVVWLVKKNKF